MVFNRIVFVEAFTGRMKADVCNRCYSVILPVDCISASVLILERVTHLWCSVAELGGKFSMPVTM